MAFEEALPEIHVERLTLATTSVPRAVGKVVEATQNLAAELDVPLSDIVIGGRSFGGRSCSVAAAEGLAVAGLLLLSYPLHPPGKPEKLRTDHFGDISIPTLFISGERDPFGTPEEFGEHLPAISGTTSIEWVKGNHSPKGAAEAEVISIARRYLLE